MVSFPNGKINLGLQVTGKRHDGYHNIETVFYPVALKEGLEAVESEKLHFEQSGVAVEGKTEDNLCLKAYHLLKKEFPHLPKVNIYLHKMIPVGAGLGGGSADGAFMLKLLNNLFELRLTDEQLIAYALQLGSDCPFFIINKPVIAKGRGEIMTPVNVDLSAYKIVLINPGIHISTKEAFAHINPALPGVSIEAIITQPVELWKDALVNDFEKALFPLYPAIAAVKDDLYKAGAVYASMTGSGSTVYGIFKPDAGISVTFPKGYLQLHLPAS